MSEKVITPFNREHYEEVAPLNDNILVEVVKVETDDVTKNGIIVSAGKKTQVFAKVKAIGPKVEVDVKTGDYLEFADNIIRPNVEDENGKLTLALINQFDVKGVYRKK